jgi:hypothetical protein
MYVVLTQPKKKNRKTVFFVSSKEQQKNGNCSKFQTRNPFQGLVGEKGAVNSQREREIVYKKTGNKTQFFYLEVHAGHCRKKKLKKNLMELINNNNNNNNNPHMMDDHMMSEMALPKPPVAATAASEDAGSLSLLLQIIMLGAIFVIGHTLRRKKVMIVHEAGAALILGATHPKTLNPNPKL